MHGSKKFFAIDDERESHLVTFAQAFSFLTLFFLYFNFRLILKSPKQQRRRKLA